MLDSFYPLNTSAIKNQNLYGLTSDIIISMKSVLEDFGPDYVFVHGDTSTTMAGSIASFYSGAKVCHIEAGLRTHNKPSNYESHLWLSFCNNGYFYIKSIKRKHITAIMGLDFKPNIESYPNLS